ncbi:MAG: peroxiredoxin family protein [Gemmatimonadaceae bacterium]
MEAYRDQYATLFNNGKKVVVLGISVDPDTMLANWARESSFPVLFGSDPDQRVGKLYGSTRGKLDTRNLFVVAPDGRIAFKQIPVNVLSQEAYAELGRAVAKTVGTATGAEKSEHDR